MQKTKQKTQNSAKGMQKMSSNALSNLQRPVSQRVWLKQCKHLINRLQLNAL